MKQLNTPEQYKEAIVDYFKHHKVSVSAVRNLLNELVTKNVVGTPLNDSESK